MNISGNFVDISMKFLFPWVWKEILAINFGLTKFPKISAFADISLVQRRTREQKIGKIGRFFGDFSVIGWSGEEKSMEKSFKKISAKNRRFF